MVLIFEVISIFQRNENRFISLVLKAKRQKAIQMAYILLKFYVNESSKRFLLFLRFLSLRKLNSLTWRVVSMLSLTLHASGFNLISSSV